MDIENIRNFIEICENDYNISKTSELVNISQPALSKMINQMESEYETEIFIRNKGRFVGLTDSGKIILNRFYEVFRTYKLMLSELDMLKRTDILNINIGVSPKILDVLLDDNIYKLYEDENIFVEFFEDEFNVLTQKFKDHQLDILILLSNNSVVGVDCFSDRLATSQYVAIMNEKHELSKKEKLHWSDLDGMKLAIPSRNTQIYVLLTEKLNQKKIFPEYIFSVTSEKLLMRLPSKNDIITILPKRFYDKYKVDENVIYKEFKKPEYWNVDIYMHEEEKVINSDVARVFDEIKFAMGE